MTSLSQLKVKIFADGADKAAMLDMYAKPYIRGLTTNPTLMRKSGIANYRAFAKDILSHIKKQTGVLRGACRRIRGNGAPSSGNCRLGGQRLRENPRYQH